MSNFRTARHNRSTLLAFKLAARKKNLENLFSSEIFIGALVREKKKNKKTPTMKMVIKVGRTASGVSRLAVLISVPPPPPPLAAVRGGSKIQIDNDNNGIVDPCRFENEANLLWLVGFFVGGELLCARRRWSDAVRRRRRPLVLIDVISAATGTSRQGGRWMTCSLDFISEECGNGGGCWNGMLKNLFKAPFA